MPLAALSLACLAYPQSDRPWVTFAGFTPQQEADRVRTATPGTNATLDSTRLGFSSRLLANRVHAS